MSRPTRVTLCGRCIPHLVGSLVAALPSHVAAQGIRDSAGVRIIENRAPAWTASTAWRVAAVPILTLGDGRGGAGNEFGRVVGVVRRNDGTVAVADAMAHTVRVFDATGRLLRSLGRAGEGPGEFGTLTGLAAAGPDALMAISVPAPPLVRALRFSAAGKFVRDIAIFDGQRRLTSPRFLADGSFAAWDMGSGSELPRSPGASLRVDSLDLVLVSAERSAPTRIARLPYQQRVSDLGVLLFAAHTETASAAAGIYAGLTGDPAITFYSGSGRAERVIRWPLPPERPPVGIVARYREWYTATAQIPAAYQGVARRQLEARIAETLRTLRLADRMPVFNRMIVADDGHLWVERYNSGHVMPNCRRPCTPTPAVPGEWDVFDGGGRWLGTVRMPQRFAPLDIGARHVTGVWRDEDDVEHVRIHELVRP
ncbi:MAG: hypothetical protein SFU84_12615 [Gemmatimonadales bacterium]|nr:hypothetical protein [Gemmatimonadales bacterium]